MDIFKWLPLVISVLHFVHLVGTYTLQRKICVDIPMKFAGMKLACDFTTREAERFLQGGNCSNQCDVSISNLRRFYSNWPHKLSELVLKYEQQERRISLKEFCPHDYFRFYGSNTLRSFSVVKLFVDCSHCNLDYTSAICNNNSHCGINAECNLILNDWIGVCFCKSEHVRINGHCYDANVPTGGACVSDIQCRDKTYSGVCLDWICTCGERNKAIENGCFAANVSIGGECVSDTQCSDVTYTGVCVNSLCSCREGYFSHENKCLSGNVTLGGYCSLNDQCSGSIHADFCKDERCVCKSGYVSYNLTCYLESNFDNMCFSWNKTCRGLTRECSIAHNKDVGMCVCKSEYLGFGENCLKGNLRINQICERNEQCTAVQDLECQNGTCMCPDGHVPVNETYCKPVEINGKEASKRFLNQEQANGLGATIGAVFGSFFLGVVLSALITYLISRRYMANMQKCDEISITFNRHSAHIAPISENNQSQSAKITEQTYQRKVVNVPPYSPSMESPTYSNVKEASTAQMEKDDVYNDLHEKEDEGTENVYNHASCSSGQTTEDDYSHLNARRSNNEGVVLPEDDVYAHTEAANDDNYFVLESQSQI